PDSLFSLQSKFSSDSKTQSKSPRSPIQSGIRYIVGLAQPPGVDQIYLKKVSPSCFPFESYAQRKMVTLFILCPGDGISSFPQQGKRTAQLQSQSGGQGKKIALIDFLDVIVVDKIETNRPRKNIVEFFGSYQFCVIQQAVCKFGEKAQCGRIIAFGHGRNGGHGHETQRSRILNAPGGYPPHYVCIHQLGQGAGSLGAMNSHGDLIEKAVVHPDRNIRSILQTKERSPASCDSSKIAKPVADAKVEDPFGQDLRGPTIDYPSVFEYIRLH